MKENIEPLLPPSKNQQLIVEGLQKQLVTKKISKPFSIPPKPSMAAYTIVAKPAAGPLTPKGEPLKVPTTIPPIIPAINPEIGGAPEAIAIPKHNGRATKKHKLYLQECLF